MNDDPEFLALGTVYAALKDLDADGQRRVIDYVTQKLGIVASGCGPMQSGDISGPARQTLPNLDMIESTSTPKIDNDEDTDGISPIAVKWMRRSSLGVDELGHVFSLGTSEIDLVATTLPGKSKNMRTRNVVLLKGIAAYLSSGVARITDEQIKEACVHYDAFDSPNHAKYLRGMASELSGSKANGFTLTARGISAGTELIKELLGKNGE